MQFRSVLCIATWILFSFSAFCDEADGIVGKWLTDDGGAHIGITKENGKYVGKIVWLKDPLYPKDDKEAGKPLRDRNNPEPERRNDPYLGITLLKDFVYKGDNVWTGGKIYNPENGKMYDAKLRLNDPDKLKVRGFIGISLLGGSTTWTRVKDAAAQPAGEPPK